MQHVRRIERLRVLLFCCICEHRSSSRKHVDPHNCTEHTQHRATARLLILELSDNSRLLLALSQCFLREFAFPTWSILHDTSLSADASRVTGLMTGARTRCLSPALESSCCCSKKTVFDSVSFSGSARQTEKLDTKSRDLETRRDPRLSSAARLTRSSATSR